ncbi:MAG: hypothetical protein H0T60_16135 [Acidobacteria bacterium]|nr:hypothetical protein [Acidobacteriota bacterium]
MIDVGKQALILRGRRKGEEGTITSSNTRSAKIGNQWFSSEVWFVMFPDGDVGMYEEKDLEAIEETQGE